VSLTTGIAAGERRSKPPLAPETTLPHVRISIGEVFATGRSTMLHTVLGSCVAVCLLDPIAGVGGMNHILLPEGSYRDQCSRFGVNAMELLINEMMKLGGDRRRFVAKTFGAGNVVPCLKAPTVGDRNAFFIRKFLAMENIPLLAQRLGGTDAVEVHFRTDSGKVTVRSVNGAPLSNVVACEETLLRSRPGPAPDQDAVTLF
jgi:chemotaxis receptor (MCP) glutamine deamidase CheD